MAKTKISEFSSTPGNNTDIDSINIAEGCAPSGINNAIRELMAQLKDFQTGAAGDSFNGPIGTSTAAAGAFTTLSASGNVTLAALTSTRVPYASTGGLLVDSANMTFNGTRLTVADLADSGLTSGRVTYASTGGALVDSANLTFDGTTLTANALTTTNAVTINGGTANGVAYLNGSKVLTTGSALTFDGAELGFTRASSAFYRATESGAGVISYFGSFGGVNYIGTTSNHPVAFYQNGSEGMRLTSTGLGIGTSSPGTRLDVSGVIRGTFNSSSIGGATTHGFEFRNATTTTKALIGGYDSSTGAYIQAVNFGTAYENLVLQPNGGNLGLGVTPSAWASGFKAFQVAANTAVWGGTGTTGPSYFSNNVIFDGARKYINTAAASEYQQNSGSHLWLTAPSGTAGNAISFTQAMTLDASGNLGVGETSPATYAALAVKDKGGNGTIAAISATNVLYIKNSGTSASITYNDAYPLTFGTNNTERARIDSSGNLLVGTTTAVGSGTNTTASTTLAKTYNWFAVTDSMYVQRSNNTDGTVFQFFRGSSNAGNISITTSTTAYNTSSDYRLKNSIAPMTGALAKVALLKPCTYKWNADGSDGEGFIAHELAEVVPQCVTGEKDAVDADGKPQYQGIDTSFLVATLTAAIQELKASLDEVKLEFDAYKATHP